MADIYKLSTKQVKKAIKKGYLTYDMSPDAELYISLVEPITSESVIDVLDKNYKVVGSLTLHQAWSL
jgi:hypothetical protein